MKQQILNEIRRLANENGGRAPGKGQFHNETQFSESDWYGKIWLRWNDAVEEAGLEPNKKQEKLPSDTVLRKYAEVCLHYGKIPTSAELRFYARHTADFLSHNTFTKHFGNKADLIQALKSWAIEQDDNSLLSLIPKEAEVSPPAAAERIQEGWVYLLQSGSHFKVGRSDELEKRIKQISISLPEKVELVHAIKTDDPPGIETYWHRRFADRRANGEWFALSSADVRAFKRRKFQ